MCAAAWQKWPANFLEFVTGANPARLVRFGNQPFGGGVSFDPQFESRVNAVGPRAEVLLRPISAGICDIVETSMVNPVHIASNALAFSRPASAAADIERLVATLLGKRDP